MFSRGPICCEIYSKVVLILRSQRLPGLFRWITRVKRGETHMIQIHIERRGGGEKKVEIRLF